MKLPCVKTICSDCGAVAYPSAGIVARRLGRLLTEYTATLVPKAIGCLECGSKRVAVFDAYLDRLVVRAQNARSCRSCDNPIPEPFLSQFRNADFCPLCVAGGKVSDAEVVAAMGGLFAGEAYRLMAIQFRNDEPIELYWLRKAAQEGDIAACSTLGDLLSRSADPSDLAEAASMYRKAADQKNQDAVVRHAEHRLALMLLKGRGVPADTEAAVRLLNSAGEKGASYALYDLAQFTFSGQFGLGPDPRRAFELFIRAHEMNPTGLRASAAVALMLLDGIGVEPDVKKGTEKLQISISIYAANKPAFDADACLEEVMAARAVPEGSTFDLPVARTYLNWIARFSIPGALQLLNRCGGPISPNEPRRELWLSNALPEKSKGHIWWVKSPVPDRIGQPSTLGQVERLADRCWIATTDAGVPVGDVFTSEKCAVEALARALECDIPFVDFATRQRRMREKAT